MSDTAPSGPGGPRIWVLLVDDSESFRRGLTLLLDTVPDVEVVGQCDDGGDARAAACRLRPHVVLMDLDMPGTNGIDATTELVTAQPDLAIIVLTGSVHGRAAQAARQAGARGFLPKGADPNVLVAAIRQAAAGGSVWSPNEGPLS